MKRILRLFLFAILIVVVVSALWFGQQAQRSAAQQGVQVLDRMTVETGALAVTVSGTGAISPERQVPLVFGLRAPITELMVQIGDSVKEGDVLARIDPTDYQSVVDDAQLAVDSQQLAFDALTAPARDVDLAVAEASLDAAQSSYNAAASTGPTDEDVEIARLQTELSRNQLWQTQLQADPLISKEGLPIPPELPPDITQQIYDTIDGINAQNRAQYTGALESLEYGIDISDANYAAVQSRGPDLGAVNSANAQIVQAQIALDRLKNGPSADELNQAQIDLQTAQLTLQQAQQTLARTELKAPFAGVIASNNLVVGQFPPSEEVGLILMDTSAYYVEIPIDETDVVNVETGQPVTIIVDALPETELTGEIVQIAASPTVLGQLVTYLVRIQLDDTDQPLKVGMSATARITTESLDNVLLVRNRFVRFDRETQQAYITVERAAGQYEEIPVTLGARNDTYSEVVSGVDAGAQIVLLPRETVIPGVSQPR
jgi:HlyD family secretion protein